MAAKNFSKTKKILWQRFEGKTKSLELLKSDQGKKKLSSTDKRYSFYYERWYSVLGRVSPLLEAGESKVCFETLTTD